MSGYDPYYAVPFQAHGQRNPMDPYPPSTTSAANAEAHGLLVDASNPSIQANMQQSQNQMPPSAFGGMDQNNPARRASMMLDTLALNSVGDFPFNPTPVQGVHNPNMLFAPGENLQLQHMQSPQDLYDPAGRFTNMEANYIPASFDAVVPLASFNYGTQSTYSNPGMGLPMAFENAATPDMATAPQAQSVNMMFPVSSYAGLSHTGMQGPNNNSNSETLGQDDWLAMSSGFGLPVSGQNFQAVPVSRDLQNSVARSQPSPRAARPSTYVTPNPPTTTPPTVSGDGPYVPSELAAPSGPKPGGGKVASRYLNIYSSSGFDMFGILARVATRPNPEIDIGAVDMSCAFILCDVMSHDDPIVYVSDAFERLTGYTKHEILGRNCRFLQSPDGKVDAGVKRKYVDDQTVFRLKAKIKTRAEVQVSMINYRKGGQSFMNLLTMIPIQWGSADYRYYVGFQVDLVEKPQAVTKRNADGSYTINYTRDQLPRYVLHAPKPRRPPAGLPKSISHDEVSAVLRSIGTGATEFSKRFLDRVLLENADDVVHVLSLKGLFLYLSPASQKVLEYEASELVGRSISAVCHPSDIAPVTRELKSSKTREPVSIVFRVRRKKSGYMWFESHGSLHIEPGKGRKCLILVGRERPVYALDRSHVLEAGGIGENDLWSKMSISGMFLFVSSNARGLLDQLPEEMVGKGLQEFMRHESRGDLGKALEIARTGRQATFKHEVRHKRGHVLHAQTTLFPGDATPGTKPSFLIAQTRLIKASRMTYPSQQNANAIIISTSPADMASTGIVTPTSTGSGTPISLPSHKKPSSTALPPGLDAVPTEAGYHGLPLGMQDEALLSETNIFEELKSVRSSSWQFELRQLERNNRALAEELQGLLSRRKKRKRKKGSGPLEKACANCGTRNTPEWRRGSSGNRDLCNSCGLRWAKQNGRISPRKHSDHSDNNLSPLSAKASPVSTSEDKVHDMLEVDRELGDEAGVT